MFDYEQIKSGAQTVTIEWDMLILPSNKTHFDPLYNPKGDTQIISFKWGLFPYKQSNGNA